MAEAIIYPAPSGLTPSSDYQVRVDGKPVFVYSSEVAAFAMFGVSEKVEVEVISAKPIQSAVIRPLSRKIEGKVEGAALRFTISKPCQLSVEINGDLKRPLFLFADPPEAAAPKAGDARVRYFEGGKIHEAGEIRLEDGMTVYLALGAVVRGVIRGDGAKNARVMGRGILDASTRTTKMQMVSLKRCANIELEGVTIVGSYGWTVVTDHSQDIRITNVKLIGWRDNDDGIDIVSSRNVTVDGCFLRTKDDCVSIKAMGGNIYENEIKSSATKALAAGAGSAKTGGRDERDRRDPRDTDKDTKALSDAGKDANDVRGARILNSVFWNGPWGNGMEIGYELRTARVEDILFKNCDIIRVENGATFSIHNGDFATVENVRFEDIRVEDSRAKLIDLRLGLSIYSADCPREYSRSNPQRKAPPGGGPWLRLTPEDALKHAPHRGAIRNVRFKNIQVLQPTLPKSFIQGFGADHLIENVVFENLLLKEHRISTQQEANFTLEHADNVRF
ncbi:MAG: glycosyl hydrolase family 28 protein [Candidatus Sumerlaeota bacterium]|nr:glycosyl hydrolase family 28 protein [Candidatus Sumerlaeota bacterium]